MLASFRSSSIGVEVRKNDWSQRRASASQPAIPAMALSACDGPRRGVVEVAVANLFASCQPLEPSNVRAVSCESSAIPSADLWIAANHRAWLSLTFRSRGAAVATVETLISAAAACRGCEIHFAKVADTGLPGTRPVIPLTAPLLRCLPQLRSTCGTRPLLHFAKEIANVFRC
jgi:hypothetical protein